ncbi:MAG: outer membrane beta-barrel protein [Vicinamibacteria bacterium]|nr:outer membrane beta-barrel protein [Vicinamibacteria bacterium]
MNKNQVVLGALLWGGLAGIFPQEARASGVEARIGGMVPRAKSILFDDSVILYQVEKKDFAGVFGGIEFTKSLAPNIELGLSIDGYGKEIPTTYRDFTRPSGREIDQTLRLVIVPTSAIIRVVPSGRYRTLAPYAGVGVAAMFWQYEEFGDFIDFDRNDLPVVSDSFKSNGATTGFVLNAGLRYRINEDVQVTADFRNFSGKQKMGGDFAPNEIDVSGAAFTLGFRLTF